MRVAIPHKLDKAEVHKRLSERTGEIANFIPGGAANVETDWLDDDHMALGITAMGSFVGADVTLEDKQVVVELELPKKLAFVRGTIERGVRDNITKLLK
jgi:hypothetical protein